MNFGIGKDFLPPVAVMFSAMLILLPLVKTGGTPSTTSVTVTVTEVVESSPTGGEIFKVAVPSLLSIRLAKVGNPKAENDSVLVSTSVAVTVTCRLSPSNRF